jgi:ubiquinone/menaquinone biosynthesis C-methylase UbiE
MENGSYGVGLSNTSLDESRRISSLEEVYDPITFRHLEALGIGPGMRCLEVGGGGGSVGVFMSDRVGVSGSVLLTDLNLTLVEDRERPNIETRVHDIRSDPLDEGSFDIIHARLVLEHIPERLPVIERMVTALRPGGWMLIEDFDFSTALHLSPTNMFFVPQELGDVYTRIMIAAQRLGGGVNQEFGRDLPQHLANAWLEDIDAETCTRLIVGGSSRVYWTTVAARQVGPSLVGAGYLSQDELDFYIQTLEHPGAMMQSPAMVSAWGRRPPTKLP